MKRHKFKKLLKKYNQVVFFSLLWIFTSSFVVFAADVFETISYQSASWTGSNNSIIHFSYFWEDTEYVNKWANISIIGNYFRGYYYDSILWYFKLDWSLDDPTKNVRIISSTTKCPSGYGYKLWWYAYSTYAGFMDFNYNNNIFVYYCESDESLHGYAYSKYGWFQSFEGIQFEILPWSWATTVLSWTGLFVNDTTDIWGESTYNWADSIPDYNNLGWDIFEYDDTKESIFYIFK